MSFCLWSVSARKNEREITWPSLQGTAAVLGILWLCKNGHKYSSLCHLWMQTIQSSGMTFKAWCMPVCLCVPNLRSSLTYKHSYCVEILCGNSKLSQGTTRSVLIVHSDLPGLPCATGNMLYEYPAFDRSTWTPQIGKDWHKVHVAQFSVLWLQHYA